MQRAERLHLIYSRVSCHTSNACQQFSANSLFCQLIQPNGSVLIPSLKSASSCISRRVLCISSSSVNGANCKGLWGWVGGHLPSPTLSRPFNVMRHRTFPTCTSQLEIFRHEVILLLRVLFTSV